MTTIVELPDGSSVEVPTDDPKAAAAAARNYWKSQGGSLPAPSASSRPKRDALQTAGDFAGDMIDNILPNWGDELAGSMDAAKAAVTGKPIGEAFERGQAEFKANQARYDKEHPNLAWASTIGGTGASLLLPGGAVVKGAGMGAKVLQGAKIGAAYGALSGAGEGEGLVERGANAVRSGVIGAGLGGTFAPALDGAALAHRWARGKLPGYDGGTRRLANIPRAVLQKKMLTRADRAQEVADRTVGRKLQEGHIATGMGQRGPAASPEAIAAELERRQGMGVPAVPGDITEPLRNTTSWASRGMGPGQQRVREVIDRRKAEEALRVRQHVIDTMGDVTDPLAQIERQTAAAKARVAPLYKEAYAQPVVFTPEIEQLTNTPAFRDALPQAYTNIRNAMRDPEALGLRMQPDGTIDPEAMRGLSAEGFDQVIRAMRDSGRAAMDKSGFRPMDTTNSVHINSRARDLRGELADQNPAYADANSLYADAMAQRDAMEAGGRIANLSGHEVNEMARAIPETAHESWALGARSALADDASQWGAAHPTGNVAARVRSALGDPTKQEAIGRMSGNTGAVRQLQDRLEAEHQGHILWNEARGNSATAGRQALDADLDQELSSGRISSFRPMELAGRALDHVGRKVDGEFRNGVKDRVAQVLTEQDAKAFRGHLDDIAGLAERDAQMATYRHRNANLLAKAAGLNIEPTKEDGQVLLDIGANPSGRPYGVYGRYEDNFDAEGNPL